MTQYVHELPDPMVAYDYNVSSGATVYSNVDADTLMSDKVQTDDEKSDDDDDDEIDNTKSRTKLNKLNMSFFGCVSNKGFIYLLNPVPGIVYCINFLLIL